MRPKTLKVKEQEQYILGIKDLLIICTLKPSTCGFWVKAELTPGFFDSKLKIPKSEVKISKYNLSANTCKTQVNFFQCSA